MIFADSEAFFDAVSSIPRITKIYVDARLGKDVDGAIVSRQIYEQGFTNVFLTTGLPKQIFFGRDLSWLSGLVGKEPPWVVPVAS